MNPTKRAILSISSIAFLGLFFFPPWYETNGQYVKQLGHHFLFKTPEAVPVECYFVGCMTAPASYFHVVLDGRSAFETLSTIAVVATTLLLLFRTRTNGTSPSMASAVTRWAFSGLVALALPVSVTPTVLVGMYGISVPKILFSGEHNWFWGSIAFPAVFFVYAGGVYLVSTIAIRIAVHRANATASTSSI